MDLHHQPHTFIYCSPASIVIAERAFLHPPETAMQVARVTMPSVPITSPAFVYRNRDWTDVSQTWERHRQSMHAQQDNEQTQIKMLTAKREGKVMRVPAQEVLPPEPPAKQSRKTRLVKRDGVVMRVRRVRAGTTGHLTLPLFEEPAPC
ncbi:hypothetical protein [Comamonas testosteroni]|uniref:hypothetical protein n=1 Tax=Comamonas testosteroni TaxID=285 RepID=UPI0006A645E5|nr:hypothetical protein [Comamonas testosteroni]